MDEATDYLDPGLSDTTEGWGVMWNVYLPLLGYRHVSGPAGAKLVPYLATSLPQISRDGRTYRLTLRNGLQLLERRPVKASDFKKTVERDFMLDSAGAAFFRNIVGAKAFAKTPEGPDQRHRRRRHDADDRHPPRAAAGRLRERARVGVRGAGAGELAGGGHLARPAARNRARTRSRATGRSRGSSRSATRTSTRRASTATSPPAIPTASPGTSSRTPSVALRRVLTGKDDWMSYYQIPSKRLAGDRAEAQEPAEDLHAAEPHVLLHEHARAAVHQPQGAAGGELRDLAALAQAPRRRPRPHDARTSCRRGTPSLPAAHPLPARPAQGDPARARVGLLAGGSGSSSGTTTSPPTARSREYLVSVLNRIGFRAEREGSDSRQLLDDDRQREDECADRLRRLGPGLSASARLVRAPRRPDDHADPQLELRELRRRLGEPRDRGAHAAAEADAARRPSLGAPRPEGDAARAVGAVPQPGRDGLLQPRVDLGCYVNNVLYEFDYASICVSKK